MSSFFSHFCVCADVVNRVLIVVEGGGEGGLRVIWNGNQGSKD